MSRAFEEIAEQQGWNETTKVDVLLRFITNSVLNDKLNAYASSVAEHETELVADLRPLGYDESKEALEYDTDNELTLFETEVGLYDFEEDPNTPVDTVMVLGAHINADDAWEQSEITAEHKIPTTGQITFLVISKPEEVELSDH